MTARDKTILVVDDSPPDLQLVMNAVKSHYKVLAATSGKMAVDMLAKVSPDLILMDVNMPEMDGYQACEQVKQSDDAPEVIFISANDSTEEILRGYDVGAADYVVKPFSPEILLSKIETTLNTIETRQNLQDEADLASETAMSLMSSSGALGVVLEFIRNSFNAKGVKQLAELTLQMFSSFELSGSVQVRGNNSKFNLSQQSEVSPLEAELLDRIAAMDDRFHQMGKRFFLNHEYVSILIKNLPVEDDVKMGRIKDCLAIAIEAAHEKALVLESQRQSVAKRNEAVSNLTAKVRDSLTYIHDTQKQIEMENISILDELSEDVEAAFIGLGLSEEQEQHILGLLEKAQTKSGKIFERSAQLEKEMEQVMGQFTALQE